MVFKRFIKYAEKTRDVTMELSRNFGASVAATNTEMKMEFQYRVVGVFSFFCSGIPSFLLQIIRRDLEALCSLHRSWELKQATIGSV